jgi:NADH-ubiquinone oxidoreductase chain 6
MLFFNIIFLSANHPLMIGLILLAQTISISLFSGLTLSSFWFSYILILVFLGGILILFIYVASIASNEKFSKYTFFPSLLFSLLFTLIIRKLFFPSILRIKMSENERNPSYIWLYSWPLIILLRFLIIYLFIVLVAIVKITKWWGGSIRPLS